MAPIRYLLPLGLLTMTSSSHVAQAPAMVTWTGSLQRKGTSLEDLIADVERGLATCAPVEIARHAAPVRVRLRPEGLVR